MCYAGRCGTIFGVQFNDLVVGLDGQRTISRFLGLLGSDKEILPSDGGWH